MSNQKSSRSYQEALLLWKDLVAYGLAMYADGEASHLPEQPHYEADHPRVVELRAAKVKAFYNVCFSFWLQTSFWPDCYLDEAYEDWSLRKITLGDLVSVAKYNGYEVEFHSMADVQASNIDGIRKVIHITTRPALTDAQKRAEMGNLIMLLAYQLEALRGIS